MPPDKPARWSPEQDRRLREAVQRFGDKDQWQQVATLVPGRDNKACRKVRCNFQMNHPQASNMLFDSDGFTL